MNNAPFGPFWKDLKNDHYFAVVFLSCSHHSTVCAQTDISLENCYLYPEFQTPILGFLLPAMITISFTIYDLFLYMCSHAVTDKDRGTQSHVPSWDFSWGCPRSGSRHMGKEEIDISFRVPSTLVHSIDVSCIYNQLAVQDLLTFTLLLTPQKSWFRNRHDFLAILSSSSPLSRDRCSAWDQRSHCYLSLWLLSLFTFSIRNDYLMHVSDNAIV